MNKNTKIILSIHVEWKDSYLQIITTYHFPIWNLDSEKNKNLRTTTLWPTAVHKFIEFLPDGTNNMLVHLDQQACQELGRQDLE